MKVIRLVAIPATLLAAGALLAAASPAKAGHVAHAAAASQHAAIDCEYSGMCAEVANPADVFGSEYVGHDEPSAVFYSNQGAQYRDRTVGYRNTQAARRYLSTERGAKTATMPAHQMMAATACEAVGPPSNSGRTVLTAAVRGWWSA